MPTPPKLSPLRRLLAYAAPRRARIRKAAFYSVTNKIFDLAPPALIGMAVDVVVERENSWLARLGYEDIVTQLAILSGLTFVIWALESGFEYLYKVAWRNLAQDMQHDLRLDAYGRVQDMELAFFEDRSTGGLMSVLNDDVNQLERFLDNGANELLQVTTTVILIGGIFFWLAPEVAWMSVLPMPFILWGSILFQKKLAPRYAKVREQVGQLNGDLAGNLGGIATIKSFTAEGRECARIAERSNAYREANASAISLSSAFSPLIRMVILIGFTATLAFGGYMAATDQLAVGAYSVMVFFTQRLLWPLTSLGNTFDLYQRAMASTTRILDLLDMRPGILSGDKSISAEDLKGDLRFENVDFQYSNGFHGLRTMDLEFAAGQTTALVGPTGAGKSTIIKLLLRFYDPTSGAITLDGKDLRDLDLKDLRQAIGLVSQEVFLFHGSVRDNIAYGNPDASDAEVEAAAQAAEADEFIQELPQGYDTIVGERGQKLSGGQRQRLSIARAVLKNPPILILDEATSAVDNETEAAIQRSMQRISVGRTIIVIAHRLSTIRNAQRIYVLESGQVLEQGTHDQLIKAGDLYAALWRVQTGSALGQQTS
ncbi:MAG: ABC transporter ATP-binding protein [Planctomycetes bacterium]|nr:ABC transporter ATP-binding protein [Planctomycetota bacterium]